MDLKEQLKKVLSDQNKLERKKDDYMEEYEEKKKKILLKKKETSLPTSLPLVSLSIVYQMHFMFSRLL